MAISSTDQALAAKKRRFFYGWWIALSAAGINLYLSGTYYYGFSAFFKPIADEFKWSYAALSLPLSLRTVESGLFTPIIGGLADKYGPRKLMLTGIFVTGLGAIWLSRVHSLGEFYAANLLLALGTSSCAGIVSMVAVANWFNRKMGKAAGIVQAGLGLGGLLVPVVVWLISSYQWRTAMLIVGVGIWAIGFPLALLVRSRPEQYGYVPDGGPAPADRAQKEDAAAAGPAQVDYRPRQALKTRAFWMLTMGLSLAALGTTAMMVHIIPSVESAVFNGESGKAGVVVTAMLLLSVVGRFGFGWLGDVWDKKVLLALCFLFEAVGLFFFALAHTVWMLIPFLITFSIAMGGQSTLMFSIQREYFGRSGFGGITGLVQIVRTAAMVASPPLAGWVFDTRGSYTWAWIAFALATTMAAPLVLLMKRPASGAQPEAAARN